MEIEVEITRNDYAEFANYVMKKKKIGARFNFIVVLISTVVFVLSRYNDFSDPLLVIVSTVVFLFICCTLLLISMMAYKLVHKATPSKYGMTIGKHQFNISNEGIREITKYNEQFTKWPGIQSIEQNKKLFIVFLDKNMGYIIPKRYFKTDQEVQYFLTLVNDHIINGRKEIQFNI